MATRSQLPVVRDVDVIEPEHQSEPAADHRDVDLLAHWMDTLIEIPIIRFRIGLDALLGLLPGAGDVATSAVSIYILNAAQRFGVSRVTMARMMLNIIIDLCVGAIPFAGDLFDAYWKSNKRNADLLQKHIEATPDVERKLRKADRWFVLGLMALVVVLTIGSIALAWFVLGWLVHAISRGTV